MAENDLQSLLDREAIRDVLMRYSRGIDRCDRSLLEGVYWPEAIDDHGNFRGTAGEFIDWCLPLLRERMDQTTHMLGNILIRLDGDIAGVESYFEAYHRIRRDGAAPYDAVLGGRYIDRMQKRGGEWRIADRIAIYDWAREYPDSADWTSTDVLGLGLRLQSNRENDPGYRILGLSSAHSDQPGMRLSRRLVSGRR